MRYLSLLLLLLCSCDVNEADQYTFSGPTHAVVRDGKVFVSDGYRNSRIAVFDTLGRFLHTWGSRGYGHGQFHNPHGLAMLSDGTLLVADRDNARIQKFSMDGRFLGQIASPGIGRPWNLEVLAGDTLIIVDGGDQNESSPRSRLVKILPDGSVLGEYGSFGKGENEMDWPHSIAASESGHLYIVDLNNKRVLRLLPPTDGGSGYQQDKAWDAEFARNGIEPLGVAYHGQRLYVSQDGEGLPVVVVDAARGNNVGELGRGLFQRAHGLSFDTSGMLWVVDVDANRVFRLSREGQVVLTIEGE